MSKGFKSEFSKHQYQAFSNLLQCPDKFLKSQGQIQDFTKKGGWIRHILSTRMLCTFFTRSLWTLEVPPKGGGVLTSLDLALEYMYS